MKKRKSSGPVVRQNDFCHDTEITIHKKVNYFIKIKNACSVKDTIKIMKKTNHRIGRNIFTMYFHQRMVFRIQGTLQTQQEENKQSN